MNGNRLQILDLSRFVAAIMVVFFHYTFNGILNGKISSITQLPAISDITKYGRFGVELFFMISGYVILISAKKVSPLAFAKSRVIRLYPAYWAGLILTSCFASILGGEMMGVDLKMVITNFSMLQSFLGVGHVDGVYWTLAYELQFYAIVFVMLLFSNLLSIEKFILAWAILINISVYSGIYISSLLGGYYSYFIAGALLSIYSSTKSKGTLVLIALSVYPCMKHALAKVAEFTAATTIVYNSIIVCSIIAMFFILFFLQNTNSLRGLIIPKSYRIGALTYPIYLIHAHIGYMLISRYANENNYAWVCSLVILFIITMAYLINLIVERKMKNIWINVFSFFLTKPIETIDFAIKTLTNKIVRKSKA